MFRREFLTLLGLTPAIIACSTYSTLAMKSGDVMVDAVKEFEKDFNVKQGLPTSLCQTGERYEVVSAGSIKVEGQPFVGWCKSKEEAIKLWLDTARLYAKNKGPNLYWRELPTVEQRTEILIDKGRIRHVIYEDRWQVYSRMLVTDKPEKYTTVEDVRDSEAGKNLYMVMEHM